MTPPPFDWLTTRKNLRADLKLVRKAVREGWLDGPGHADQRAELVRRLGEMGRSDDLSHRGAVALMRTLMAMDEANAHSETMK